MVERLRGGSVVAGGKLEVEWGWDGLRFGKKGKMEGEGGLCFSLGKKGKMGGLGFWRFPSTEGKQKKKQEQTLCVYPYPIRTQTVPNRTRSVPKRTQFFFQNFFFVGYVPNRTQTYLTRIRTRASVVGIYLWKTRL